MHPKALKVQTALRAQGSMATVIQLPESTGTAREAAAALGTTVAQIVKSLVFLAGETGVVVLVSGIERVSLEKLGAIMHVPVTRPPADVVKSLTGYAIGGVPPLAHVSPMRMLMDRNLLKHRVVWAAAGTPHAVFSMAPSELQRVAQAELVDVTEEEARPVSI